MNKLLKSMILFFCPKKVQRISFGKREHFVVYKEFFGRRHYLCSEPVQYGDARNRQLDRLGL